MDSHFQRKKKETFIAELMIGCTCPSKGLHGMEPLIFNNVLNTKCWKLRILNVVAYIITDLIDCAIWDMNDILADKVHNKFSYWQGNYPQSFIHLYVSKQKDFSFYRYHRQLCLLFTGWYLCVFLSVYFWPLQKCTWRQEWLRFLWIVPLEQIKVKQQ